MMKPKKISLAVAGACALLGASAANAGIGFKAGEWDIDFSGNVNAFYTGTDGKQGNAPIVGGLAQANGTSPQSVRSGLLPSALVFSAKSRQGAFDVGVTFGFYPAINSSGLAAGANLSGGQPIALGTAGIDLRQNFVTFGDTSWGTVKLGRDIGLFGSDAILSDMTLLGVGSPGGNAAPANTALGRIGLGYVYTDFIPQIIYTSPKFAGFQVSGGVFTPLNGTDLASGLSYTSNETPGFQGKVTYDFGASGGAPGLGGRVWAGFVTQEQTGPTSTNNALAALGVAGSPVPAGVKQDFQAYGYDAGAKLNVGIFEGVVYGYRGQGLGTTGLFLFGNDALGNKRDSNGYYGQLAVKFGPAKIGVSYGRSQLSLGPADVLPGGVGGALVKNNESGVAGIYYALTKSLNLVGEYIRTQSQSHGGQNNKEDTFALGAILFF